MVSNINQLLVQAQTAYNAADWSSLIQYLQQLILGADSEHPEIVKNRQYLLTLALSMGRFSATLGNHQSFDSLGKCCHPTTN